MLGFVAFSCRIRQRTRRLAWRGRSTSAASSASSLRTRRAPLTMPSAAGCRWHAGLGVGRGGGHTVTSSLSALNMWMRGPGRLGVLRRGSTMRVCGSKSWKAAARGVQALLGFHWPRRPGTRRRRLHHKAPRRNDNEAAQGGFSGPQNAQHGAIGRPRQPHTVSVRASPSMAKRSATISMSASLLRLMAKSQSMVVSCENKTGTYT